MKWNWGKILIAGQQREFQNGHLEIDPDAGLPFRRERFSDIGEITLGSIILSQNDAELFKYWYKNDTRQGAIPFEYYDCTQDIERVGRFLDKPTYSYNSNKVVIQFKFIFTPQAVPIELILCVNAANPLLVNNGEYIYQSGEIYL